MTVLPRYEPRKEQSRARDISADRPPRDFREDASARIRANI